MAESAVIDLLMGIFRSLPRGWGISKIRLFVRAAEKEIPEDVLSEVLRKLVAAGHIVPLESGVAFLPVF